MIESLPDLFQALLAVLGLVGLLQALLLLLLTCENIRFCLIRLRTATPAGYTPPVELFVPCKGVEASFADTVRGILNLDYPSYSATFIVESSDDPAYHRLKSLLAGPQRVSARLLVGSIARDCGQKVHNLLTATAQLDEGTEVLAFLDSDAVPDGGWLRRIVFPLHRPRCGVAIGYRWFLSGDGDWPGAVLSALNASVAFAAGNHPWNEVWGGSWAIRRAAFDQLREEGVWQGALTEDLPVGQFIRRLKGRVVFEPNCLAASPIHGSWRGLVEFARRQYLIVRVYAPGLWWFVILALALAQGVFWGAAFLALWAWAAGRPAGLPAALAAALYGINTVRALLRQYAAACRFPAHRDCLRRTAWIDVLANPLLGLVHLLLMVASASGRIITWRTIRYRLHGPHRTEILFHPGAARPTHAPAPSGGLPLDRTAAAMRMARGHGLDGVTAAPQLSPRDADTTSASGAA